MGEKGEDFLAADFTDLRGYPKKSAFIRENPRLLLLLIPRQRPIHKPACIRLHLLQPLHRQIDHMAGLIGRKREVFAKLRPQIQMIHGVIRRKIWSRQIEEAGHCQDQRL